MAASFFAFYVQKSNFITNYLGLEPSQYGDISSLGSLVGFLVMAPWGKIADATGRHKFVLGFCSLAMAGSFLLLTFITKLPEGSILKFIFTLIIMALYSMFAAGMQPLTDFHALRMLEDRSDLTRDAYGRQRVWGTISYGFITFLMGVLVDAFTPAICYYVVPLTSILFVFTLWLVAKPDNPVALQQITIRKPKPSNNNANQSATTSKDCLVDAKSLNSPESEKSKTSSTSPSSDGTQRGPFIQLMTNPNYIFLLLFVFLSGSARAVMTAFASLFWKNDMKLSNTQIGIASNFGILMEIFLFFMAPLLLRVFGIYWMLIFSQTAMAVRSWCYAYLKPVPSNFIWVYLIELLKGTAFGFGQIAGVKICVDVAPPGLEATAQAIYTSFYSQLPAVLATFFGGRVYQAFGASRLFLITAILSTVALGLFFVKYSLEGRLFGGRR